MNFVLPGKFLILISIITTFSIFLSLLFEDLKDLWNIL